MHILAVAISHKTSSHTVTNADLKLKLAKLLRTYVRTHVARVKDAGSTLLTWQNLMAGVYGV